MLAGIDSIRFDLGTMGIGYMAHCLGFTYMQEYSSYRLPSLTSDYTPQELEVAKDAAVREYAARNTRWHQANQNFRDLSKVESIPKKLKSLRRIDVTCKNAPFASELLLESWIQGSGRENFKRATKEFLTLLLALKGTSIKLQHLSHDQLPITFFAIKEAVIVNLASSLQHLTTLHLTLGATNYPHPRSWCGLGNFLRSIPNLKMLRFGFAPFDAGTASRGHWIYAENNVAQWYVPLWRFLGDHTWKELRSLRLDGLLVCETGLVELLMRHAPTLRYLDLFDLALWAGSFQGLLSSLKSGLSLRKFRLWGIIRGHHAPYDCWRLRPPFDADGESWTPELKAFVIKHESKLTAAWKRLDGLSSPDIIRRLDLFMTPGIPWPWPLHESDALHSLIHPRFFSGHHTPRCQSCVRSISETNMLWDEGTRKPLKGWVDNEAMDTPGIGEEELLQFYDEDGYDEEGFDENGFNEDGLHYMQIEEEWQGAKDPISSYAASRIMRDSILSQISRYSQ